MKEVDTDAQARAALRKSEPALLFRGENQSESTQPGDFSRSEGAPGNHGCGANGWRKRAWRGKTPEMTGVPHFDSERNRRA